MNPRPIFPSATHTRPLLPTNQEYINQDQINQDSQQENLRERLHQVLLTGAYIVAFIVYAFGLKWHYIADGPLNFGYSQCMFICGILWLVSELLNIWWFRACEVSFYQNIIERLTLSQARSAVSSQEDIRLPAAKKLKAKVEFGSIIESFGIIFGLSLWLPDPVKKRFLRTHPDWDSEGDSEGLFGLDLFNVNDVSMMIGAVLFCIGWVIGFASGWRRWKWIEEAAPEKIDSPSQSRSENMLVYGVDLDSRNPDKTNEIENSNNTTTPSSITESIPNPWCYTRHANLTGQFFLLSGWAFMSCSWTSLIVPFGIIAEYKFLELPEWEENLAILFKGRGVWDRYCGVVKWKVLYGVW